eukprot:472933-Rhodomonas_salina.1
MKFSMLAPPGKAHCTRPYPRAAELTVCAELRAFEQRCRVIAPIAEVACWRLPARCQDFELKFEVGGLGFR